MHTPFSILLVYPSLLSKKGMGWYVFQSFSPDHQVHLYTNISRNQSIYVGLHYYWFSVYYVFMPLVIFARGGEISSSFQCLIYCSPCRGVT